jgi:hypothetical protein
LASYCWWCWSPSAACSSTPDERRPFALADVCRGDRRPWHRPGLSLSVVGLSAAEQLRKESASAATAIWVRQFRQTASAELTRKLRQGSSRLTSAPAVWTSTRPHAYWCYPRTLEPILCRYLADVSLAEIHISGCPLWVISEHLRCKQKCPLRAISEHGISPRPQARLRVPEFWQQSRRCH